MLSLVFPPRKHCCSGFTKSFLLSQANLNRSTFTRTSGKRFFFLRRGFKELCARKGGIHIGHTRNASYSSTAGGINEEATFSGRLQDDRRVGAGAPCGEAPPEQIPPSPQINGNPSNVVPLKPKRGENAEPPLCKKENGDDINIEDAEEIDKDAKRSLLEVFKYKKFTDVQKIIYENVIREKKTNDLLVQAKTGTGKTISYLLLAINDIERNKIMSVHTLIIVPTRELANQIYNEAKMLLTFKNNINVLTLIGGIKRREDQINLRRIKPDIVICTVGRLLDHFECTYLFNTLFDNLKMLIIDEADQLLSLGYENDINRILTYLPKKRRNLLFSATLNHNLDDIRQKMCKPDYMFLNCVKDPSKHTNEQLKQYVIFHKAVDTTVILYNLLMEHMRLNQFTYKILVFFPTARATCFYANFFKTQLKISVYEIHRKKEPAQRQITANRFAVESVGILFTSDISSRGINYPDVTLIIQVNCAISREQYIHRVGRTARSNKDGTAILLLNEADELFYQQIKDLNIQILNPNDYLLKNVNVSNYLNSWMSNTQLLYLAYAYYSSLLRFYKTKYATLKLSDDEIIDVVNNALLSTGLVEQPHISSKLAIMLNMQNNTRLKIRKDIDDLLL
ncbi:DEAD box helicase, putative [Plasmodium knowlesi strain H]|uniref:ATP-dependent RNA helicase n=3 Tax=Plasmodium knowlesi TaxID=5850 RepID=A0A5K1VNS3_PLAKH|nr:ATP-dependent RNA helicase DBP6, putative [Plasmodium knowlesi strain H]OTN64002.1 putative DEAD box helicase [Plasmodium knowlesi]CAA9990675.1 ATP-dependent RNA helicase DBP6, putative [Plasmodium knowlesi strain H]SBO25942.1 DEAD box helicase, putative [Plasmodium knowlesi strain H]SBO28683.1 DEAD box helicase, putative [Plasmodium knowlesi strain H]VVS80149.1 ATP-dependent RNA helicase DBP6, putative [Plasmodium knowlesi strain H]|eukprot:XP_002261966.1 DEAD box helicase, putative [Plasmodium knowlesi strain H]